MKRTVHVVMTCLLALMVTVVFSVPTSVYAAGTMNKPTADDVVYYKDSNDKLTGIKSITINPYTYYNISRDESINPSGNTLELNDATLKKIVDQQIFPRWAVVAEGIFRDQANQLVTIEGSGLMSSSKTDSNSFDRQFSYKRPGVSDSYKDYKWSLEDLAKSLGTPDPKNMHLDAELPEFKRLRGSTNEDEVVYSGIYGINNLSEARTLMGKSLRACADDDDLTVDDFLGNGYDKSNNKYRLPDLATTDTGDGYCSIVTCVNRAGRSGDYDYVAFGLAVYDFDVTPIAASELSYIHSAQEYMEEDDPIEAAAAAHVNGVTFDSTSPPDTISYLTNKTPQESASTVATEYEESEEIGSTTENTFEFGMEQEIGTDIAIGDRDKSFARATIHLQFNFHELWNTMKGTSESRAKATRRTVSQELSLPGHTAARIVQSNSTSTGKENYQQPVVLNYKVAIFAMSGDYFNGWGGLISDNRYDKEWMSVIFDGSDAADLNGCRALSSLYNRAINNKDTDGYDRTKGRYKSWCDKSDFKYSTKINWGSVASVLADDTRDSHNIPNRSGDKSSLQDLASELLFAETARAFVRDRKVSQSTVESLVPLYNLDSVDITKGSRNYEMRTGNKFYLDSIELDGFDRDDVSFYGFKPSWGKWELSSDDATGATTTESDGVSRVTTSDGYFTLATDNATGSQWTEVRSEQTTQEKTYRLDWKLDTDSQISSYETLNDIEGHPNGCMKTAELEAVKTPTVGFSVKSDTADVKSIAVSGAYEGPYDQTINLNKELDVSVIDGNDHLLSIPIYWEDNDVHTIDVHESGETKFSTPGTYKVRAFSWNNGQKITSNWITITAKEKAVLSRIGFSAADLDENDLALTKKNQSRSYDLNSFLSFYDQFDKTWEGTEEDPLPTISFSLESGNEDSAEIDENGILTVSEPGTYRIAAKAKDKDGRNLSFTIPKVKLVITADRWLDSVEFDSPAMGQNDLKLREKGDQIKISNLKSLLSYYDQKGAEWTGETPRVSFRILESTDGAEIKSGDGYSFFAYKPGVYTIQPVVSGFEVNAVTLEVTEDPYLIIKTNDPVKQYITGPDEPVVLDLDKYVNATTQFDGTWKDTPAMKFKMDEGVTGAAIGEKTITVPDPDSGDSETLNIVNAFVCDTPGVYTVHVAPKKASAYDGAIDDIEITVSKLRKVHTIGLDFSRMTVDDKVLSDSWRLDPAPYLVYRDQFGDVIDKSDYGKVEIPEVTGYTVNPGTQNPNNASVQQNEDGTFTITATTTGSCNVFADAGEGYEKESGYLTVINKETAQAIRQAQRTLRSAYLDLCWSDPDAEKIYNDGLDSIQYCTDAESVQETLEEITGVLGKYGHKWGAVTYTWSTDNKKCTATRSCTHEGCNEKESETVDSTSVVTDPTCTAAGFTTYTAEFVNEAFAKQTKKVDGKAALGHKWKAASGTEPRTCERCGATEGDSQPQEPTEAEKAAAAAKESLNKDIAEAKNIAKGDYTDESYKALQDAIAEAEKLAASGTATKEQLDAAASKIAAAKNALKKKEAAADPTKQYGADGTALGKGASAEAADKAIRSLTSDKDPKGAKFAPLMVKSTKRTATSIRLSWKKVTGAKKYVIYGNVCGKKNKFKKLATVTKTTYNVRKIQKKLKKGTNYKFIVVALDSTNHVVAASKVTHIATKGKGNYTKVTTRAKNNKVSLKKGKTFKLGAKAVGKNVRKCVGVRYESSNPKVAKVTKSGKITAKKKGKCKIYVFAQNGVCTTIKVTVK